MKTDPHDNAFPVFDHNSHACEDGLSKREEFTKAALTGLLASGYGGHPLDTGLRAVQFADAAIAALNRSVPT